MRIHTPRDNEGREHTERLYNVATHLDTLRTDGRRSWHGKDENSTEFGGCSRRSGVLGSTRHEHENSRFTIRQETVFHGESFQSFCFVYFPPKVITRTLLITRGTEQYSRHAKPQAAWDLNSGCVFSFSCMVVDVSYPPISNTQSNQKHPQHVKVQLSYRNPISKEINPY